MKNILIWLCNDLRLNDNLVLEKVFNGKNNVSIVCVFNEINFEKTELNLPKTGVFRVNFLVESVIDFKKDNQ